MIKFVLYILLCIFVFSSLPSKENKIFIASTTSTNDTGLLEYLNNKFENKFNIKVQVLSLGTGQALKTAKDGNVEILLVHHKISEEKFMSDGYGVTRYNLMYNDYVIVGPKNDNNSCIYVKDKFNEILLNDSIFISRGDDSGTHKKELEIWSSINKNPKNYSSQYLEVGQSMGNTLLIANEKLAYTISDRATWIAFNRRENLKIICESRPPLFNQYGVILVNPNINKNLNYLSAKIYINWLISNEGKILINNFKKKNKQLFFFNYN